MQCNALTHSEIPQSIEPWPIDVVALELVVLAPLQAAAVAVAVVHMQVLVLLVVVVQRQQHHRWYKERRMN